MELRQADFDKPYVKLVGEYYVAEPITIRQSSHVEGPCVLRGYDVSWDHRNVPMAYSELTLRDVQFKDGIKAFISVQNPTLNNVKSYESLIECEEVVFLKMSDCHGEHANGTSLKVNGRSWSIYNNTFRNRLVGNRSYGAPVLLGGPATGATFVANRVAGCGSYLHYKIIQTYYPGGGWVSMQLDDRHDSRIGDPVVLQGCGAADGEYRIGDLNRDAGTIWVRHKPGVTHDFSGGGLSPPMASVVVHTARGYVNECVFSDNTLEGLTADAAGNPYLDKMEGSSALFLAGLAGEIYKPIIRGNHLDAGWKNLRVRYAHHIEAHGNFTGSPDVGQEYEFCDHVNVNGGSHVGQRTWPATGKIINPNYDTQAAALRFINCTDVKYAGVSSPDVPVVRAGV